MWKCPVCETEYGDVTVCPKCGFDGSCDYEHYPTPFAVAGAKSTRALRREWEQKQGPGLDQLLMEWMLLSTEEPSAAGAEMYLRRKADQGSREAQLWLGNAYRYGVGAKQDDVQAAQWYQKASDQQYALAQYMLGRCYEEGRGVPKDIKRAVTLYGKAAGQDCQRAQLRLGQCLAAGRGAEKNPAAAAIWFKMAANRDYPPAQNQLG